MEPKRINKINRAWILICLTSLLSLTLGIFIGYFATFERLGKPCTSQQHENVKTSSVIDNIIPDNIKANLKRWTSFTHLAGTEGSLRLANELASMWEEQGLDTVENITYEVLLSYPNKDDPNLVYILDGDGNEVFRSAVSDKILLPEMNVSDIVAPYDAFSPAADVNGSLVFINFCTPKDFFYVTNTMNINITGTIVICKDGDDSRELGLAVEHGAVGILFFRDPADWSDESYTGREYPHSWWLPPSGVARNAEFAAHGDALTPGYPAVAGAYRDKRGFKQFLDIPIQPISYADAGVFMGNMGGPMAPKEWWGNMNISYRLGPGFLQSKWKVRLHVNNEYKMENITNVIGYIHGNVEPDRYVILGNHRDAWAFGAADPTSGTAVLAEITRVLADLLKDGWRPKRTLVFCSWGAEEQGLIGSVEWVENFMQKLKTRAVAYLNLDNSVHGNETLFCDGSPLLKDIMLSTSKKIPSAYNHGKTMYDEWIAAFPNIDGTEPMVFPTAYWFDHVPFMAVAGIASVNYVYTHKDLLNMGGYPLYHTPYETFSLIANLIDPEFQCATAMGRFTVETILSLADSLILPFNILNYADFLDAYTHYLEEGFGHNMTLNGITLDYLHGAVADFRQIASDFHNRLENIDLDNPNERRMFNDQMMLLDRYFIADDILPLENAFRHVVMSPSWDFSYPGLMRLLYDIKENDPDIDSKWEEVKRHLSTVVFTIKAAAVSLQPGNQV